MPATTTICWKTDPNDSGKAITVYTIVDDGDEICIRATISQRWELAELVTKLQQRVDGLPVNLTTYIDAPSPYPDADWVTVEGGSGKGATATITVKDGAITNISDGYQPDAQDVNRKELSNER